jgi:hypothetical protein
MELFDFFGNSNIGALRRIYLSKTALLPMVSCRLKSDSLLASGVRISRKKRERNKSGIGNWGGIGSNNYRAYRKIFFFAKTDSMMSAQLVSIPFFPSAAALSRSCNINRRRRLVFFSSTITADVQWQKTATKFAAIEERSRPIGKRA